MLGQGVEVREEAAEEKDEEEEEGGGISHAVDSAREEATHEGRQRAALTVVQKQVPA